MTGVLQQADFTLASGRRSSFKVECDELTPDELAITCAILAKALPPFGSVVGVPTGGVRAADALVPHCTIGHQAVLVVDDVWTTGGSMRRFMAENGIPTHRGAVLYARGPVPSWVTALWTIHPRLWDL